MRLLNLNIRHGLADDGPFSWHFRRNRLCQFLRDSDADLICLQEVFDFQRIEISSALPDYNCVGVGRNDGRFEGEFAPIFYRGKGPSFLETFWLSEEPDRAGSRSWGATLPRICTWAKFGDLTVANLHLDHESESARRNGSALVLQRTKADVICGDFNATPDEEAIRLMLGSGYRDLAPPDGTFNNFIENREDAPKIDYVFARGGLGGSGVVIRSPMVSDHWAIIASVIRSRSSSE